jgi:hypothetical protein
MKPPLEIKSPCSADWNAMTGDDRKRLCAMCDKHVHNLSALTRREALEFAKKSDGSECIGYSLRADGSMVNKAPWTLRMVRWLWAPCAWLLAMCFGSCAKAPTRMGGSLMVAGGLKPIEKQVRGQQNGHMLLGEAPPVMGKQKISPHHDRHRVQLAPPEKLTFDGNPSQPVEK